MVDGHVGVSCCIDEGVQRGGRIQRSVNQLVEHLNVSHHYSAGVHFAASAHHRAGLRCVSLQARADESRMPGRSGDVWMRAPDRRVDALATRTMAPKNKTYMKASARRAKMM